MAGHNRAWAAVLAFYCDAAKQTIAHREYVVQNCLTISKSMILHADDKSNCWLYVSDGSPDDTVSQCFRKRIISSLAAVCAIVATVIVVSCTALVSGTTDARTTGVEQEPTDDHRLLLVEELPTPTDRCPWVLDSFAARDGPDAQGTDTLLAEKYTLQSKDFNVFFRASAPIFWHDYVTGEWGEYIRTLFQDLDPFLSDKATWTWVCSPLATYV